MTTKQDQEQIITLTSPDGQFFRRIHPDGTFEQKKLGMDWEPHDPRFIGPDRVPNYVSLMTKRLKWRASFSI